jgi:Voltage gated calcium channel IQ domain
MDKNDEELRESIKKLWPIQGPKMHTLLVPPNEGISVTSRYIVIVVHYRQTNYTLFN